MPMPDNWIWPAVLLTSLASFVAVGFVTRLARSAQMLDEPGKRASHSQPTPTGGGIGLFLALLLISLMPPVREHLPAAWTTALLPGMTLLSIMGWLDDRSPLSPWLRLLVQLSVSLWLLMSLTQSDAIGGMGSSDTWPWPLTVVAMLGLSWIMNAYNFMDGSDGMAGGQGVFSATVLGFLFLVAGQPEFALCAWMLAAACLGFLPWNFPRARVFMGDAGSVPLGFALGGLVLTGCLSGSFSWAIGALMLAVFLVDATLTLVLRVLRGEQWYTPHNKHVYQQLIQKGWSHGRVLALYQGINVLVILPGMMLSILHPDMAPPIAAAILLVMTIGWCIASLKWGVDT